MYGAQQFFGGSPQQVRAPSPQQYLSYGGYTYYPTQTSTGFDMNSMMNMMMMIMVMSMMMNMMKPMISSTK